MTTSEIALTFTQWERAKQIADARMKHSNGHYFVTILKTRCQYCGRSPRARGRCGAWFQTFLAHLDTVVLNVERELGEPGAAAQPKRRNGESL